MNINMYCDGASKNNGGAIAGEPIRGSFAIWFVNRDNKDDYNSLSHSFSNVTNNQMELLGALYGVAHLIRAYVRGTFGNEHLNVKVYSDSKQLVDGVNKFSLKWRANGFKTYSGGDVSNQNLWKLLLPMIEMFSHSISFEFIWVKGHKALKTLDPNLPDYQHYFFNDKVDQDARTILAERTHEEDDDFLHKVSQLEHVLNTRFGVE